jgi:hypothetical protein
MRIAWAACICVGVLMSAVTYLLVKQPAAPMLPAGSMATSVPSPQQAVAQKPAQALTSKDEARLPNTASEQHAVEAQPVQPLTDKQLTSKDEARLPRGDAAPADVPPAHLPARNEADLAPEHAQAISEDHAPVAATAQEPGLARVAIASEPDREDVAVTAAIGPAVERNDTRQDLSYLAYYAYSELPPNPKPARIVLDALKGIPFGTPIEEIKLVSRVLGLDFTFMKAVAKIESGFDPLQRTGSYIGLFQLSDREFGMYGAGDILVPRDNTVAAALKFMTEDTLFEMFTHKKPTLNDTYLVHQQGVDGATEHVSHPQRLAWRSMCATDEGKEKGERWCKLAIWGNTLPALKRAWKNVNNVTSSAFVGMWHQRLSEFYTRYSQAAAAN